MRGWLVVNSQVRSDKFSEIYGLLLEAATACGLALELRDTADPVLTVGGNVGIDYPDFAIFWDKDIYYAQMLEDAGVRLFNTPRSIALCDNKALTCLELARAGIAIPKTVIAPKTFEGVGYPNRSFLDAAACELGYPMVVKEVYGSFGQQVYLANDRHGLGCIVDRIGYKDFLLQEFVESSFGRDVRINVIGDEVVSAIMRVNEDDFRSNISNGGKARDHSPSASECRTAVSACRALGLDFGGVDLFYSGGQGDPIVCEVNSNPHFKSSQDCNGIDVAKGIMKHIGDCL